MWNLININITNLINIQQKSSRFTDIENKLVVTSEGGNIGVEE